MNKLTAACTVMMCSMSLFGWNSVTNLESEAIVALSSPANLLHQGFTNNLNSAIQSTNQAMRIDAELIQSIVNYQRFLNTADGRLVDSQRQCLSNVVSMTMSSTNSWQFWAGRLLLASTYAGDNDFGTSYQMLTNGIQMMQDSAYVQETNALCDAILSYYEMTNINVDVAFKVFAGMSSAGLGMGAEATNYANQVSAPYHDMILEFVR